MIEKLKNNPLARRILLAGTAVLSGINQFIPKDENKILFYDSARDFLDDNSEALYTYFVRNGFDKKYRISCCVPNEKHASPYGGYVPLGAIRGVLEYLTSKYVFFSFGDFRIRPSKDQIVVNQWHGTGTKKGGKQLNDKAYQRERLDNFTYLIASSEAAAPVMAAMFGCPMSKILIQGFARNDYLFSEKETLAALGIDREKYRKAVIWMPTFRNSNDNRFHDGRVSEETQLPVVYTKADLEKLNEYLATIDVLLVIKPHPLAALVRGEYSNIKIFSNTDLYEKRVRLYEFIKDFDALLTDYSSVFPDFLLLDRPIGFTLDDYDEYERTRGFFFDDLKSYMPGHHIYNFSELRAFFDDIVNETDRYRAARQKVIPVFWKYADGENCKRLVETLGIRLN